MAELQSRIIFPEGKTDNGGRRAVIPAKAGIRGFYIFAGQTRVNSPLHESLCDSPAYTVIPSGARNLALSIFKAVQDSSSPAAPRNDTQTRVITQTPEERTAY
jgi:hypothetical protein